MDEVEDGWTGDELNELGQHVQRLHDVATDMQAATGARKIHEFTVGAAVDILGFDWCAVQVATEGYFEVVAVSEQAPLEVGDRPITTDHGITGDAFGSGTSMLTDDAHGSPDADPTLDEFRSGLTVPIGDRGVFQGVSSETGFFDEQDLELAELLITHATAALDRVEQSERLRRLTDATRRLMSAENHDEVMAESCGIAASILDAPVAVFYRLSESGDRLVPVAASESAPAPGHLAPIQSNERAVWSVLADETSSVRVDEGSASEWNRGAVSLVTAIGNHGLLALGSDVDSSFDGDDVALAETLAASIESAWTRADREQTLRERTRRLQRQNERLDRFASVVSHDLRNPLNIALTRTELAGAECDSDHLGDVENALDRMATIIDSTLSLARQGQALETVDGVSLGRIATESWSQVDTRSLALDIVDDPEMLADPDRLRTVFENLFRNSVEHGPERGQESTPDSGGQAPGDDEGGDSIRVRVGLTDGGFYVEDTGSGIPESERARIFELGYSSDGSGTGFGMAIVREVVDAHGWDIHAGESNEGGARFEITGVDVQT